MKLLQICKNIGCNVSTTQLMGLLFIFSMVACSQCDPGLTTQSSMDLEVSTSSIQGEETVAISFKNKGKQGGPMLALNNFRFKATMSHEQGSAGSQLVCKGSQQALSQASIDCCLNELITSKDQLSGQDQETIHLGITPHENVSALTIIVQLFEKDNEEPIDTKTIHWSAKVQPTLGKLKIVKITHALGDKQGEFFVKAVGGDVAPQDIEVAWAPSIASLIHTDLVTFKINQKDAHAKPNLADLLGNSELIPADHQVGPIYFQVDAADNRTAAINTISFTKGAEIIGKGDMEWTKKNYRKEVAMEVQYGENPQRFVCKVTNLGAKPLTKADQITLMYGTSNQATIQGKESHTTAPLQIKKDQELNLPFKLNDEKGTRVTFQLMVDGVIVLKRQSEYYSKNK